MQVECRKSVEIIEPNSDESSRRGERKARNERVWHGLTRYRNGFESLFAATFSLAVAVYLSLLALLQDAGFGLALCMRSRRRAKKYWSASFAGFDSAPASSMLRSCLRLSCGMDATLGCSRLQVPVRSMSICIACAGSQDSHIGINLYAQPLSHNGEKAGMPVHPQVNRMTPLSGFFVPGG